MRARRSTVHGGFIVLHVFAMVAWGALAFGANYPWAYVPLIIGAAVTGLIAARWGQGTFPVPVAAGLGLLLGASLIQLIPMSRSVLAKVSPAADRFLQEYDIAYAWGGSGQLSINPWSTAIGAAFLLAYGMLAIGLARALTRSSVRAIGEAIAVIGAILAFLGIGDQALGSDKVLGFWVPLMPGGESFGPFVNRNHFAGWMLMAVPVTIGLLLAQLTDGTREVPSLRAKLLGLGSEYAGKALLVGFAAFIMVLSLVLTMSRSGMLAVAVALGVAMSVARFPRVSPARRVQVAISGLAVGGLIVALAGTDELDRRVAAADAETMAGRIPIWQDGWRIASDFPLTGAGLNTFGTATILYQQSQAGGHLREAHNDYLQLAAEGGMLLGLPIVLTIAAFVRGVRRRLRADTSPGYWLRVGAVTGIGAVAIQSVFEFSLQMPGNALLFAVLCGIALHSGRVRGATGPHAMAAYN